MKIIVMRHGEAETIAKSDQARRLTARGKAQANAQGRWLKSILLEPDNVLVSPYVRAQETLAQLDLAFARQLTAKQEIWEGITPYGDAATVADYLAVLARAGSQSVLLVSHLPLVGEIVAQLCPKSRVSFYPATMVCLEWDGEHAGTLSEIKYPE
ncbi:phosphohistidine phosphatase SixA [Necropsobacter massiliensis]|uniref:phosphohistidine phosphatase SixA n=1 Tax=Necropsobacter massiliensis TaxID=1400001 RepID=UPI0005960021|nr:phosphohistidine phosphatase SixA [Necropsobacter massiliensis]